MDISLPAVKTPTDVLAVVPYLLGFTPERSIVVIAMRDRRVVFQARADVPATDEVAAMAGHLATVVARQRVDSALIVAYGADADVTPTVDVLRESLEARQVRVSDALRADGGRYWSYVCQRPECCPPSGTPYDVATTALAAEATYAGLSPAASRRDLEARLAPVDGLARIAMRAASERAERRLSALLEDAVGDLAPGADHSTSDDGPAMEVESANLIRAAVYDAGVRAIDAANASIATIVPLDDDAVAWLALLLIHVPVRDYAWERIDRDVAGSVDLWTEIVRRVEPDLVAAPATLLAYAAWRNGGGAIASIALDRALDADPACPMARLLLDAIDNGLAPSAWLDVPPPDSPRPVRRRRQGRRGQASRRARVVPPGRSIR
jgi:Domain of unknown function (DUF4192)